MWKKIPLNELYEASDDGDIRRISTGHIMAQHTLRSGYVKTSLRFGEYGGRVDKTFYVHRLVASAFFGESGLTVNHKNGVKSDNCIENLEYLSNAENIRDGFLRRNGRILCIDRDGRIINKFNHMKDCALFYGISIATVSSSVYGNKCVGGKDYGFIYEKNFFDGYIPRESELTESKPVIKVSDGGNIIYKSIGEAARKNNISPKQLRRWIDGMVKREVGKWKFVD